MLNIYYNSCIVLIKFWIVKLYGVNMIFLRLNVVLVNTLGFILENVFWEGIIFYIPVTLSFCYENV